MQLFCLLYYVPIYFQVVKNFSPVLTGVAMLPVTCILLPASAVVGALMRKYGVFRPAIWLGWLITIISSGLLSLLDTDIRTSAWVLILMVVGLGHGLVLMAVGYSIQAVTDPAEVAYATAMYTFLRSFGMCIGVAIGAVVFQNRIQTELTVLKLPADAAKDPEGFVNVLKALPMDSPIRQSYNLVYSRSIETVFLVLMVFAILGGLTSLFIKHTSTDVPLESQHKLEKKDIELQQV
jgi:MFS family permease